MGINLPRSSPDTPRPEPEAPYRVGSLPPLPRYSLAPLAGYTNWAFRLAVRELGGLGLATTDLVNARALMLTSRKTMELIHTTPADRPLAIQIYGTQIGEMCEAAQWLQEYGATVIDINMGCPVNKVVRGGGGSAMMCDPLNTVALVRAVVESVSLPVTVKMRLGWDDSSWSAPFFAREFEKAGVAAVTIHGRTREQGFRGRASLDGIRAVVESVERMPILGNGDVLTVVDALHMRKYTGCAGVAIGRGALLNPWLFSQLQEYERTGEAGPVPTYGQRLRFMDRHFQLLVESRGERFACLTFRKVANWYCKVLRPGRDVQQILIRLDSAAVFASVVERLREREEDGRPWCTAGMSIPVPGGPNERW
jgi:tRNA-dihydrouridine synthase B